MDWAEVFDRAIPALAALSGAGLTALFQVWRDRRRRTEDRQDRVQQQKSNSYVRYLEWLSSYPGTLADLFTPDHDVAAAMKSLLSEYRQLRGSLLLFVGSDVKAALGRLHTALSEDLPAALETAVGSGALRELADVSGQVRTADVERLFHQLFDQIVWQPAGESLLRKMQAELGISVV